MAGNADNIAGLPAPAARLLAHLDAYPRWHSMADLQSTEELHTGDADAGLPLLLSMRLAQRNDAIGAIAITAEGEVAAQEVRKVLGY